MGYLVTQLQPPTPRLVLPLPDNPLMSLNPPRQFLVPITGGIRKAHIPAPRAFLLPRPLQHLQVAAVSGGFARRPIPRAVVLTPPPQHLQVPAPSGARTRLLVPRTEMLPQPLQHLQ